MSQYADLLDTFRQAEEKYQLSQDDCVKLLVDVLNDMEWDIPGVKYDDIDYNDWEAEEHKAMKAQLFPNEL